MCTCTHIKSRKSINCIQSFTQSPIGSLSWCWCTPTPGLSSSPASAAACGCPCIGATMATRAPQTPPGHTHPAHPSCTPILHRPFLGWTCSWAQATSFLISSALSDGRLGPALSEFYVQLYLRIVQVSYYKNRRKQQQPVTWVSQCPHHKFPASGPAHYPQLTGKKKPKYVTRTCTVTTSVPGTKGTASN